MVRGFFLHSPAVMVRISWVGNVRSAAMQILVDAFRQETRSAIRLSLR